MSPAPPSGQRPGTLPPEIAAMVRKESRRIASMQPTSTASAGKGIHWKPPWMQAGD